MELRPFTSTRARRMPGILVLVAASLVASLLAGPAAARAPAGETGGAAVPELAWTACGDEAPGFECATAQVPLDYDRPRGPRSPWP
jgi:hypothetical protein